MSESIWLGAVAYDPKVVTIWEGMRRYFLEEAGLPVEIVLFQSYEAQVSALLAGENDRAPRIDIAWNTNLAYLQSEQWSEQRCRPIAMRDTDLAWTTKIFAVAGGPVKKLADLRNRTLALGSRDSGHAAILPVHFLQSEGLLEEKDYRSLRFNSDVGKHGDTGRSEAEVVRAVLDGRADAGAVGNPFWKTLNSEHLVPEGALLEPVSRADLHDASSPSHQMLHSRTGRANATRDVRGRRGGQTAFVIMEAWPPVRSRRRNANSRVLHASNVI